MKITKEPSRITELIGKWKMPKEDILSLAASGKLNLSVWWGGFYHEDFPEKWGPTRGPLKDYVNIGSIYARMFLEMSEESNELNKGQIEIYDDCYRRDGQAICLFIQPSPKFKVGFEYDPETTIFSPMFTQSDLRVLAEEVHRFESDHSELLNDTDFTVKNSHKEDIQPHVQPEKPEKPPLRNPPGSKILTGWKEIFLFLGVSIKTAKNSAKKGGWLRFNSSNKPTTTTFEINEWRLLSSTSKKK